MKTPGGFRNGPDSRSYLFPICVTGRRRNRETSTDRHRAGLVSRVDPTPWGTTMNADGDAGPAGVGSAARVLALAQKLHDEYVAESQNTREKLISEGQSRHDQVVVEATARQEELLSTGQAKYDELLSAGKTKHDALIAEAETLVAEAQQKKTRLLQELDSERRVLQKQIEELRTFERDHHAHLKSYLQGQLITLEQSGADQTG